MAQVFCCHCLNYRWQPLHGNRNSLHLLELSDTDSEITQSQSTVYLCVHMCFQQNLPEKTYMRSLCSFLFQVGQLILSAGGTLYCLLPSHSEDFHWLWRHPLHLFIFSGGIRELPGKEGQGSSCRHDSSFLGRLCRVWATPHGIE